jgi:hypothetical protein
LDPRDVLGVDDRPLFVVRQRVAFGPYEIFSIRVREPFSGTGRRMQMKQLVVAVIGGSH